MKKNIKSVVSIIAAVCILAVQQNNIMINAGAVDLSTLDYSVWTKNLYDESDDQYSETVEAYGEEKIVVPVFGDRVLIITPDGNASLIQPVRTLSVIKMKDGNVLTEEDIVQIKECITSEEIYDYENNYVFFKFIQDDNDKLAEVLENINGIEEMTEKKLVLEGGFNVRGLTVISDTDPEDYIKKYPALNLEFDEESTKFHNENGENKIEFRIRNYFSNAEKSYSELKNILSDGSAELNLSIDVSSGKTSEIAEKTVYTADIEKIIYGDLNESNEIDLSDLTSLSQYILKDITLTEQQQKNADVNADGEVDISDLALLKQYVMNDDVKLGAVS